MVTLELAPPVPSGRIVIPVLSIDTTVAYCIEDSLSILNTGVVHGKQKQSNGILSVLSVSQGAILFAQPTRMCPSCKQSPHPLDVGVLQLLFKETLFPKQLQQEVILAIVFLF
jgi:hypothetical protein